MTVSVIVVEPFKNDEKLMGFEEELRRVSRSPYHSYAPNVYFANHAGTSRALYEHLCSRVPEVRTELIVLEVKDLQDNSWRTNGKTFDWLNEAFGESPFPAAEFQREVKV